MPDQDSTIVHDPKTGRAFGSRHRRVVSTSQLFRWMSDLPTDPVSRAADFYQGTGTPRLPGKHRAGRHAIPAEHMVGETEYRNTPHNVRWGKHCLGRWRYVGSHRHWNSPYHR